MSDKIRIFALGGLDEEGKNCCVVEINDDIFVVETGAKEPDKTQPGVDYVIPRFDYLVENKDRIRAYFLLHGHDDEIAALPYIYPEAPAPVYGSKVTLMMLDMFTRHIKKDPKMYDLRPVGPSSSFKVAGRKVSYFHTAHNIADSSGIAISTDKGNIIFTSDFVVENNATPDYLNDMNALARIAEEPTLALLPESFYAGKPGYTAPNYKLRPHVEETFKNAPGRIFVSVFSPNLYNVDEIIRLAIENKKKLIWYDEATADIVATIQASGKLNIPRENAASLDDILRLRDQDIVVVMTGFGFKLLRKVALLASGQNEDRRFRLKESDTFIVASPAEDNTEIEYTDAVDELYRCGCHVLPVSKKVFLKMHASEEDLKMMASILKPKFYIPVKGFYKDLLRNATIALGMGIGLSYSNIFLLENGMSVILDDNGGRIVDEKIPHGDLLIDGEDVGDISQDILAEREELAEGVVIMALTLSKSKREIIAGPDVQMRGFVFVKDAEAIIREVSSIFVTTVKEFLALSRYNIDEIKQNVYERCLRGIRRSTGKDPMILPIIIEQD